MKRASLDLGGVTLCAATSVNLAATIRALRHSMDLVRFGDVFLFTDASAPNLPAGAKHVPIARLHSSADYSRFMLHDLHRWIATPHCLVIQWDGFVLNPAQWDPAFLACDYVGAPWPQFEDGHDVGNGGFSLRSQRLLRACRAEGFVDDGRAEDLVIGRTNRAFLEREHAICFADAALAAHFSHERHSNPPCGEREKNSTDAWAPAASFGFHGVFNMVKAIGPRAFGEVYRALDHRWTAQSDLWSIVAQLLRAPGGRWLAADILRDALRDALRAPLQRFRRLG